MSRTSHWMTVVVVLAGVGGAAAQQECAGLGDLDADGTVGLADLGAFAVCMAGPGVLPGGDPVVAERADFDTDSDVDLGDFASLAQLAGRQYFDYGPHRADLEAEMLAMELSGQLRAPDAEYDRILGDLAEIRTVYAELIGVIDDPDYVPNELIVGLVEGQPLEEYEALNAYYLLTGREHLFGSWWTLSFCDNLNARVLGPIYTALAAVQYADPNGLIGTDDQIAVAVLGETYRYTIDDGFWDCFDGCDCHRVWVIDVSGAGAVSLVSYEEYGMSWCEFD
jgi:hypothetical protein